jgi:MarR family transcriptional regulator, organic hydroperoxide resistance regulator
LTSNESVRPYTPRRMREAKMAGAAERPSRQKADPLPSRRSKVAKPPRKPGRIDREAPRLGEALEFLRLVWALDHGLQSRSKRMRTTIGLTGPQRLVIRIVSRYPRILAGELAAVLHLHPSTLTGILERLERRRLLVRRTDESDRRRAVLEVTKAGKRLDVPSTGTIEASVARALAAFPKAKLDATREVLEALTRELTEVSDRKDAVRRRRGVAP